MVSAETPSPDMLATRPRAITLVVFAPFGTDKALSTYPDGQTQSVAAHPLLTNLRRVSELGVNVCALIDRVDDDSWLVTIPARGSPTTVSNLKVDMASPRSLRGLLQLADERFPRSTVVLAMEGHGAGYLPDIDASKLTVESLTQAGSTEIEWTISSAGQTPTRSDDGEPLLPMGEPMLPMGEPMLPTNHYPISTWGMGWALARYAESRKGGQSNIAVIHFNNCFNMSVELLHCVAPFAKYATGYSNYNFFTSGGTYPAAFGAFLQAPGGSAESLARALATANRDVLAALPLSHPTVGSVVALSRMNAIKAAIDALANALIDALPENVDKIKAAITQAQQYDTLGDFALDVPDEMTDIGSLANILKNCAFSPQVTHAASVLAQSLDGVFVYGVTASPWVSENQTWALDNARLAMNILLPDPALAGRWDWRSPYYLETVPGRCVAQPNVIDFLRDSRWVEFIKKYHAGIPFLSLLAPRIPEYPVAVTRIYPRAR